MPHGQAVIVLKNNDFQPIKIGDDVYPIAHLKGLGFVLQLEFGNGDIREVSVFVRPTNHVFSRSKTADDEELRNSQHWLTSYTHETGNYQAVPHNAQVKEHRIFCPKKWAESHNLPLFIEKLAAQPTRITVLANAGDDRTCLSGLVETDNTNVYLVFFTLHRLTSKTANMLIESAFCVDRTAHKAQLLINHKNTTAKPFVIVLRNVLEGRKPMVSPKTSKRTKQMKQKAKNKKQKAL